MTGILDWDTTARISSLAAPRNDQIDLLVKREQNRNRLAVGKRNDLNGVVGRELS